MTREQMRNRPPAYPNRMVRLCAALREDWIARVLGQPLHRSGTSVGANCRPVCRAMSNAGFVTKLRIVEEQRGESPFWIELLVNNGFIKASRLRDLMKEADETLAIVGSAAKTARSLRASSIVNRQS